MAAIWIGAKNPMLFARALHSLSPDIRGNLEIDVFGEGTYLNEFKDYIKTNFSSLDIRYHGIQNQEKIAEKLRIADFLAHPTNWENLPVIIIESLCCGTPVLSNDIPGVDELVNDSNGTLTAPDDTAEFGNALIKMIGRIHRFNRKEISEMSLSLFDQAAFGRLSDAVFQEVITKH